MSDEEQDAAYLKDQDKLGQEAVDAVQNAIEKLLAAGFQHGDALSALRMARRDLHRMIERDQMKHGVYKGVVFPEY